ncbi:MAG: hypothetical protein HC767_05635 [Akkermansiaceae bacterium]|nr:hypothetical protein [Akkermansiaceae bacterium]
MKNIPPDESGSDVSERGQLCSIIRAAFEGVKLGDGVGLYQAQGIDDHESDEACSIFRERDEKDDWTRITSEDLNNCYSSLSFFDAEGMRFYLPAYLLADLNGEYKFDLIDEFTNWCDYKKEQYSLLSDIQRDAVSRYLRFIQDKPGNWLDAHKIDVVLESLCENVPESSELQNEEA